jgi:hypothetical protein
MKSTCHSNIPRQPKKNVTWTAWVCGVPFNKFRGKFIDLYLTSLRAPCAFNSFFLCGLSHSDVITSSTFSCCFERLLCVALCLTFPCSLY